MRLSSVKIAEMKCALVDSVGIKIESIWKDVGRAIFDPCMAMNDESAESITKKKRLSDPERVTGALLVQRPVRMNAAWTKNVPFMKRIYQDACGGKTGDEIGRSA